MIRDRTDNKKRIQVRYPSIGLNQQLLKVENPREVET